MTNLSERLIMPESLSAAVFCLCALVSYLLYRHNVATLPCQTYAWQPLAHTDVRMGAN